MRDKQVEGLFYPRPERKNRLWDRLWWRFGYDQLSSKRRTAQLRTEIACYKAEIVRLASKELK